MKKILLAFDSFKGSVGSLDIAKAAEKAILKVYPHCNIATFPIADGGEGTTEAICTGLNVDRIGKQAGSTGKQPDAHSFH